MADVKVTTTFPEEAVPTLQAGLDHYNQQHGTSHGPKEIIRVAVIELLAPHAEAVLTEQIGAQAERDREAESERVRVELEKIT